MVDGDCTLPEAVDAARLNLAVDACAQGDPTVLDRVTIPGGLVELVGAAGDDSDPGGDLDLTGGGPLAIEGADVENTFIQGTGTDRIFDVVSGSTVISDLKMSNGGPSGPGGGIQVAGGASLELRTDESPSKRRGRRGRSRRRRLRARHEHGCDQ